MPTTMINALGSATAHIVNTGLGPLYDGVTHLALSPADLIPMVALGMLAAMHGPQDAKKTLLMLPPVVLVSAWLGGFIGKEPGFPVAAISFTSLGILIATNSPLPRRLMLPFYILVAGSHGWSNAAGLRPGDGALAAAIGITLAATVVLIISAGIAIKLNQGWQRICLRILGSWTAATGLLLFGWWLKSGAMP